MVPEQECHSPHYHMICGDEDDMTDMIFSNNLLFQSNQAWKYFLQNNLLKKKKTKKAWRESKEDWGISIILDFALHVSPGAPKGKRAGSYAINVMFFGLIWMD